MYLISKLKQNDQSQEKKPPMQQYQREFLEMAMRCGVLRFGQFTLKSGRQSPYFFNAGLFHHGIALATVGRCYAQAIQQANCQFDVLFGPAYKGIPFVTATAIAFAQQGLDVAWCFNRKEAKDHGEGGAIVGAPLTGRVLLIDDVITAGTALREAMDLLAVHHAQPVGVVVALDRQERSSDTSSTSALRDIAQRYRIPVISLVTLADVLNYVTERSKEYSTQPFTDTPLLNAELLAALHAYREQYGVEES